MQRCWLTRSVRTDCRVKLDQDRRAEMVALEHGRSEQMLFRLANILSFGKYTTARRPNLNWTAGSTLPGGWLITRGSCGK